MYSHELRMLAFYFSETMRINKALVDRALDMHSANDEAVAMYHRLIKLIDQYNTLAEDKGLPIKNIPSYNNRMNCTLLQRLLMSILKDIDRIKNIKEEEVGKTAIDVSFTIGTVTDFPELAAWKDGLWYYIQDGDDICIYGDTNAVLERMNGGTELELDYEDMPYEVLVDKNGRKWKVNRYTMDKGTLYPDGLFGIRSDPGKVGEWNINVVQKLTSLILRNWTNRNVTDMTSMFETCKSLTTLDLSSFGTSEVTNMALMFFNCASLQSLTLGENFNTSKVQYMSGMFSGCEKLQSLTLGDSFNTSNVKDMTGMFADCSALQSLTLGNNFNTSKVEVMREMFLGCTALQSLTLGNSFNTSSVRDMYKMFEGCTALASLTLGENFNTASIKNIDDIFKDCTALTTVSLYKSANAIIAYLPSGTWDVKDKNGTVSSAGDGTEPTWNPADLPNGWGEDEQWTLTLQPPTSG